MIYIYSFLLVIILFLLYMRYEAGIVKLEKVRFTKSSKGLRIIQLSDIHMRFLRVSKEKVRSIISSENPDIIIITGDYIDTPRQIKSFLNFLNHITDDIPIYLCMGNHDHKTFRATADLNTSPGLKTGYKSRSKFSANSRNDANFIKNLSTDLETKKQVTSQLTSMEKFIEVLESKKNVKVLDNKALCIKKNSKKYNIIGIDDLNTGNPCIEKALSDCDKSADINIAFSHNPDIISKIPKNSVDYLFCGHFHGGQIWMPFNIEYKLLRKEKLCKMGISRGLHKLNGVNLYINRGLGNVCFPLRFLSRPEITVFYMP
ncbi:MAG: metallophosphoesterase [Clostridiaceae bacterium]|nr:metallophosphoesterase [Clostridiaceae bacterium]